MVASVPDQSSTCLHHIGCLLMISFRTCVESPVVHISCGAVCKDKGFHLLLGRLLRHILHEPTPAFDANPSLIHRHFTPKRVCSPEIGDEGISKWSEFIEGDISRLSLWNVL